MDVLWIYFDIRISQNAGHFFNWNHTYITCECRVGERTMGKKNLYAAVDDLKKAPYERLLKAFRVRCESIGKAAGTVYTNPLSYEELIALADFMGMSVYALNLQRRISLKDFEGKLQGKYPGVKLEDLLSVYFEKETVPFMDKK